MSTSIELPTNLLVARPQYIWACPLPSLSYTSPSTTNSNLFGSIVSLSFLLKRIRIWVSFYLSLWNASSGPNYLPPILGKDAIPAKHLTKEAMTRYWKQAISPLPPNHTLCKFFDCEPTSLALAGYRLVVLQCCYSTTLCFCFLSFLHCFCYCCSSLSCFALASFSAHAYPLCRMAMGLLGLPHFCLFLGPMGLLVVIFCQVGPLYLFFFPSSLLDFYGPLFLPLLTNLFSPSLFVGYWAFMLLGPFYKKTGINKP